MEGLLEAIFSNFFLILLIVSGLLGFFRNNKQEEQKKKQPTNRPNPVQTPSGGNQRQNTNPRPNRQPVPTTISVEEQQKEQMERLAGQLKTATNKSTDSISERVSDNVSEQRKRVEDILLESKDNLTEQQDELKKQIGSNLKRKGFIQGIIMSEVLGPPRATKPYRSVIEERKIR